MWARHILCYYPLGLTALQLQCESLHVQINKASLCWCNDDKIPMFRQTSRFSGELKGGLIIWAHDAWRSLVSYSLCSGWRFSYRMVGTAGLIWLQPFNDTHYTQLTEGKSPEPFWNMEASVVTLQCFLPSLEWWVVWLETRLYKTVSTMFDFKIHHQHPRGQIVPLIWGSLRWVNHIS